MSDTVTIGSARHDEFGGIGYGKNVQPGDQTGHECETQDWYLHDYGWVLIRPKSADVAEYIAHNTESICANDNIGYSQPHDQTLYAISKPLGFDASKVDTPCETDCARAERVNIAYAGVQTGNQTLIDCPDFYTGNEISVLQRTGEFDIYYDAKYTQSPDYLRRGDILCTPKQGHTVTVLSDGKYAHTTPNYTTSGNVWQRTGPGTDYDKIQVVPKNTEFNVLSTAEAEDGGIWAQGEYKGIFGYVSAKYLTPAISMPTYTTTGNVYMRKGPGTIFGSICVIPKGTRLKGTGNSKKVLLTTWYEVIYDGKTGWVSGKYLAL